MTDAPPLKADKRPEPPGTIVVPLDGSLEALADTIATAAEQEKEAAHADDPSHP